MGYSFLSEKKHELLVLCKIINGLCPDNLSSLVPLLLEIIQHIISVMHLITNICAQILNCVTTPFFLSSVRDWTELPHTIINATSIGAFKSSFNSTLIGVPLFYLDGKPHLSNISCSTDNRLQLSQSPPHFNKTLLIVRFAFVVDQKLPSTTCLIVLDLTTCARK